MSSLSFTNLLKSTINSNSEKTFATWYNDEGKAVDEYSFSDIWEEAGVIAHHLRIKWKLKRGDRVVLCVLISPACGIFENGSGLCFLGLFGGSVVLNPDGFRLFNI